MSRRPRPLTLELPNVLPNIGKKLPLALPLLEPESDAEPSSDAVCALPLEEADSLVSSLVGDFVFDGGGVSAVLLTGCDRSACAGTGAAMSFLLIASGDEGMLSDRSACETALRVVSTCFVVCTGFADGPPASWVFPATLANDFLGAVDVVCFARVVCVFDERLFAFDCRD